LSYLAFDLLGLGHLDQAVARRNQGLMLARKVDYPYGLAVALYWASAVDRLRGAQTTHVECLTELATLAREQRFPLFCWVAELAHRPARSAEAEDCYQHALALARKQQAKFWELNASTSLAHLWRDQGKRSEARDLFASIYGWFTEGLDTPVLKEAKTLLAELA